MEASSFGYWLRLKRKALDLTREGLAARVGCSAATIQKLEEEERRPSAQMVERLEQVFDISPGNHPAFLRFARGELDAAFVETKDDSPRSTSPKGTRSNLPAPVTSLIGRTGEIEDLRDYLLRGDVRLVTLLGPPGIGKTRLSIEAARAVLSLPEGTSYLPDGVFFVSLASLDDQTLLAVTVAQALGYVGGRNISTEEHLKEGIGDKRMLIVLDNCEHLIEYVASLVSDLLSACPGLSILATSRESLRVAGEWLYPVPAFDLPGAGTSFETDAPSAFPILSLFAERARMVQPDFRINAENFSTVAAICRQSDGLPLAVELIAARIRSISPQALLERLSDSFLVYADGMRAVPTRQRSLNDAIAWSYRLLSDDEQKLLAFLSVFSGEFTLEAAQALFAQALRDNTLSDLITSLLDKSLLQRVLDSRGEARYAMLATIREFARRRLGETDQEVAVRNLHLAYFVDLAGQADLELRGPNQPKWLNRRDTMHDNLRVALDWAIETGQTETSLQLACRLWWFWSLRSEFGEARQWLQRILAMPEATLFPDLYADALTQLAHHSFLQIGGRAAKPFIEQALAVARARGKSHTLANALVVLGLGLASEGSFTDARIALEESISLFRELQDRWGYALALMSLSYCAFEKDDQAIALTLSKQAMAAFRDLGDRYFQCVCLYEIGTLQARRGDWEGGFTKLRESLSLAQELSSNYEIASALLHLAETEQHLGHPARAVRLYCAAKKVYETIGAWLPEADPKLEQHLGLCRAALGESAYAEAMEEGHSMAMEQAIDYALERSPHPQGYIRA